MTGRLQGPMLRPLPSSFSSPGPCASRLCHAAAVLQRTTVRSPSPFLQCHPYLLVGPSGYACIWHNTPAPGGERFRSDPAQLRQSVSRLQPAVLPQVRQVGGAGSCREAGLHHSALARACRGRPLLLPGRQIPALRGRGGCPGLPPIYAVRQAPRPSMQCERLQGLTQVAVHPCLYAGICLVVVMKNAPIG